jgi:hypothetical protein
MSTPDAEEPWYADGLSFACTRCGRCCTGAPGYVWVNAEEIAAIATYRNETLEQFSKRFVRRVGGRYSLVERPRGDCIFWSSESGCTVYAARPAQCQTWPFWPENIADRESWDRACVSCPGSGAEGARVFSVDEIRATAARVHTP